MESSTSNKNLRAQLDGAKRDVLVHLQDQAMPRFVRLSSISFDNLDVRKTAWRFDDRCVFFFFFDKIMILVCIYVFAVVSFR